MRVSYVMDEGLPCACETGGSDTVESLQKALKYLNKGKDIDACEWKDIEIYFPDTTKENFREKTPLASSDKLPQGTTSKNFIFVHVPRDVQDLTPEQRKLYANPTPAPASPKPKPMARPPATQLKKPARDTKKEEELARKKKEEDDARRKAEREAAEKARRDAEEKARRDAQEKARREAEEKARREAEEKARRDAEEKARRDAEEKARQEAEEKARKEKEKFVPTPMDMSTFRCHYQIADTIPYYIRINGWEKVGALKERILETRRNNCPYLDGITDAAELKIFPPGTDEHTGKELEADDTIPDNSSMDNPLVVLR